MLLSTLRISYLPMWVVESKLCIYVVGCTLEESLMYSRNRYYWNSLADFQHMDPLLSHLAPIGLRMRR